MIDRMIDRLDRVLDWILDWWWVILAFGGWIACMVWIMWTVANWS